MTQNHADSMEPRRDTPLVSLADEAAVKQILSSAMLGLWEVANNLSRLRPSRADRYRVTIFGSARITPDSSVYDEVRRLAQELAGLGCDIVTGGGPGLMQAANEGAQAAGEVAGNSLGIRVGLPFEQGVNPFVEQAFEHRTFFTRLHHFVLVSDAFVIVPGGIGTVLETMMVWQLLQVRHLYDTPLVLLGSMWKELVDWATRHMVEGPVQLANPEDMRIPTCLGSVGEAVSLIRAHWSRWQLKNPRTE